MKKIFVAAALVAGLTAGAAQASGLVDNFDTENGGVSALNYTGFANFDVIGDPGATVDIIGPTGNLWGLSGGGSYVDLDGSSGVGGAIITKQAYSFNAGDKVTLSFDLAGDQRGGGSDNFFAGFRFADATDLNAYAQGGAWGSAFINNYVGIPGIQTSSSVGDSSPWQTYSLSFVAASAGSLKAYVGTDSRDNVGPLADNFNLSIGAVPEPATWAMMIAGFGLMGAALRNRRRQAVFAA